MKNTYLRKTSRSVPSTELVRHFSDYLAQVRYSQSSFIIEKNNKPVARLCPAESPTCTLREFSDAWQSSPPDPAWADAMEAIGEKDLPLENPWP